MAVCYSFWVTKGRLEGREFQFSVYKNVFKSQIAQALCYLSSLFTEKDGLGFKVQK